MNIARIQALINLGLFSDTGSDVAWLAQLDSDEADEVFATQVGTLVWAD